MKVTSIIVAAWSLVFFPMAGFGAPSAEEILQATGVDGGLVVHLGCGDGHLTAGLRAHASYLVQGLDTDAASVAAARRHLRALGCYGNVVADTFDGKHLPYTDNLVNLLVVSDPYDVSRDEIMRALAPDGVAYIDGDDGWSKIVKPRPKEIDEWTHYLHGPDNNAVARDTVVGPPRHMQWLAGPRWTRNHHNINTVSAVVTAGGRIFSIVDQATSANMAVPAKWSITARDAFSGVKLWQRKIASWASNKTRFRSGPAQVTRLLVASKDLVYAPLDLNAPISALDAATGKIVTTFENTEGAEEIIQVGDVLLVLKGAPVAEHAVGDAQFGATFRSPNDKSIVAVNVQSGKTLWQWSDPKTNPMPETLGSDGRSVYFQVNDSVTCLDLTSGKERWTFGERGKKTALRGFGRYVLVVVDGVVLCKLSGQLTALSAGDGSKLWECEANGGFHAPMDLFVINGLVWQGMHPSDSVAPPPVGDFSKGRDLHTGEVKAENTIAVDLQTAGHHHRCYREKATVRYILTGKRGIEMMDLVGDEHSRNNWVRGTCQYGILPANGLTYAPPHSCGCYMESLLWGFWALAPKRPVVDQMTYKVPDAKRLEKGPAYDAKPGSQATDNAEAWPQYRHDALRSGIAGTVVPSTLTSAWKHDFSGRLTQPVVAEGRLVLAAVDENTVYALHAETGEVVWHRTVGGRVDSPPAIYRGTVLFGSADGWVYCLRLDDGELMWRLLAAPADLKTVAEDQVESLWPVHGSVLVLDDVVYCAAGRSTWIDRGIYLYALEPTTGRVLHKSHFESTHPRRDDGKGQEEPEHVVKVSQNLSDYRTFLAPDRSDSFSMAGGSLSDVLTSDGRNVFMHQVKFDAKLERQAEMSRHLFSTSNMLDGAENHRSHWVLGTGDFSHVAVAYSWIVNGGGNRWKSTIAVPTGLMMVYGDYALWGVRRKGTSGTYTLFEKSNTPFSADEESLPDFRVLTPEQIQKPTWNAALPLRPRAMLKSGGNLFVGAMPTGKASGDPAAAYDGLEGGTILVVSAEDGEAVAQYPTDAPIVWDGMAAAAGKLFVCTEGGQVLCWRGE
ncbi:MAG: PQQ-binding-like beta-propeller repeat protein [Thermoguttaceae bacterium]